MSPYDDNRAFGDRHIEHAKEILGSRDVRVSTGEEDWDRNTDLITFKRDEVRTAFRVRRASQYLKRYGDQFTIRVRTATGQPSELAKIKEGWGDQFLYGFGTDAGRLVQWVLGDLSVLRRHLFLTEPPRAIPNRDGSAFCTFDLSDMPHDFILDASWDVGPPTASEQLGLEIGASR